MPRDDRQHYPSARRSDDGRTSGQKDYDRILYCSAFRRLTHITQVVAADQGALLHNRLIHTLKVAQLGRRLAAKLKHDDPQRVEALGGLDADVVEAACLAHDLGHPPFGHVAEKKLSDLAEKAGARGGFEGNAQSFRIVTKLAVRLADKPGLDLSRATLNALLKYPWIRTSGATLSKSGQDKFKKWGAYDSESDELDWVRRELPLGDDLRTLEAEVMDFADDIAYSIYDIEDFYRANRIPVYDLFRRKGEEGQQDDLSPEAHRFFEAVFARWRDDKKQGFTGQEEFEYKAAFIRMTYSLPRLERVFDNTHLQRTLLRDWTSLLVGRYMQAFVPGKPGDPNARRSSVKPDEQRELAILKEILWHYVILDSGLATQQHGYKKVIETLFHALLDSAKGAGHMFPAPVRETLESAKEQAKTMTSNQQEPIVRAVVDYIASLTETEALTLYRRLEGVSLGSFQDAFG